MSESTKRYNPKDIEPKWQQIWADTKLYRAVDNEPSREKYYYLVEFPYPSGDGLHVGHVLSYTALDIMTRHKRMQGFNVLYPMGFDEFGLPTENYAIKHKIAPQIATERNVANFRRQMKSLGLSFDWDREVRTSDPNYYKWTQWIFLKLLEQGLAYQAEIAINWCPFEKTGLANEEVVDGKHERCGTPVEKKLLKQWMLKITAYADRLAEDLAGVDYLDRIAAQQINWIGRSEGAEIDFKIDSQADAPLEPVTGTPQPDEEFRRSIVAVVRDPKTGKLLTINWGQSNGGSMFIGGGIEDGEDVIETARREVAEETGYLNLKHLATSERVHHHYVAHSKGGKKRYIHAWGVYFELENDQHDQPQLEEDEAGKFHVEWQTVAEVDANVRDELHRYMLDTFILNRPFTGDRLAYTSDQPVVTVYTTRPDTLAGATFLVLAPEHPTVARITTPAQKPAVDTYVKQAQSESEVTRQETDRPKTGVFTGAIAKNPLTGADMPVWIADYVLAGYGTGAIMAVPAHDQRDRDFAQAFGLPITPVVAQDFGQPLPDAVSVEGVVVIGYDPKTKKYLALKNGDHDWLISGGREKHETMAEAAKRELAEEAGYHQVKELVQLGTPVYSFYYNKNKQSNRRSLGYNFLAILDNSSQGETSHEAHEKFTTQWLSYEQLRTAMAEFGGGAHHWLEAVERAKAAVEQIEHGQQYQAPVYTGQGILVNSAQFDGLPSAEAKHAIAKWLFEQGIGRHTTKYKLRDWIFSRQHYWGEPIPVIHCPACGAVPVPEDQLPVKLPEVESYEPTDTGESPLAAIPEFVNTACPKCSGPAKRETDTMPNWAGSSWYWLRYTDPHNDHEFAAQDKLKYWTPVDLYNGGMEHTTLHLLYARFWHKFLYDQGLVPTPEPYTRRRSHGMILGPDGVKMSKSRGNVINPDHVVDQYGADTIRLYEMFMGPFDAEKIWSEDHLNGVSRFIYRVWTFAQDLIAAGNQSTIDEPAGDQGAFETEVDRATHKTLKKVHHDIEGMQFNTAVSALMEYINFLTKAETKTRLTTPDSAALRQCTLRTFILMLAPFTPHLTEELWHDLGETTSVHSAGWPKYDPELIKDELITIVVQVNGKVRANLIAAVDATEAELTAQAQADPRIAKYLAEGKVVKTIIVPRKLVNFVVK